jgi:hypothetical protein
LAKEKVLMIMMMMMKVVQHEIYRIAMRSGFYIATISSYITLI